jgi:hypothetical protein
MVFGRGFSVLKLGVIRKTKSKMKDSTKFKSEILEEHTSSLKILRASACHRFIQKGLLQRAFPSSFVCSTIVRTARTTILPRFHPSIELQDDAQGPTNPPSSSPCSYRYYIQSELHQQVPELLTHCPPARLHRCSIHSKSQR